MISTNYSEYLLQAAQIACNAGRIIMSYYSGGYKKYKKFDDSPVTEADIAANDYITKNLAAIAPEITIIAEEDKIIGSSEHKRFFLVDPLDGTSSFVRGEPEFTVNIALIEDKNPIFGVIYCPVHDILYFAMVGDKAYKKIGNEKPEVIKSRLPSNDGVVVARSRSHPSKRTNEYLDTLNIKEIINTSSSAKFCMLAEGSADIYPRFGRTMEWDTAAGHAILLAAGGSVETIDGNPLLYGKENFENLEFIAYGTRLKHSI